MSGTNAWEGESVPKTDEKAPAELLFEIKDAATGQLWGTVLLKPKSFATGSRGYYASTKVVNPENADARYQCSLQMILIGSKLEA
jgi:hypothetical protein